MEGEVPSNAFCNEVQTELDDFQKVLLNEALRMYPEGKGSETPVDEATACKRAELERKLEMYTNAAHLGVEVRVCSKVLRTPVQ